MNENFYKHLVVTLLLSSSLASYAGDGSYVNPYTVTEFIAHPTDGAKVWVKGYIVGSQKLASGTKLESYTFPSSARDGSNIELAESPSETSGANCIAVATGNSDTDTNRKLGIRNYLDGSKYYDSFIGQEVMLYGPVESYYGNSGLKSPYFALYKGMALYNSKVTSPALTLANELALDETVTYENAVSSSNLEMVSTCSLARKFENTSSWNAICLPFSLTPSQVKNAFGDDVKIASFTSCNGNTLNFTTSTSGMAANVPYLISGISKSDYTFNSVMLEEPGNLTVSNTDGTVTISFVGNYNASQLLDAGNLYMSNGQLIKNDSPSKTINTYSGYFTVSPVSSSATFQLQIDGIATGITSINNVTISKDTDQFKYNMNGQRISYLQKGHLYIVNGKKALK
jgi:hypothetical protein